MNSKRLVFKMEFKKITLAALISVAALSSNAGGLLTNTNQSISFLRNPAREGCIGIDGVYSNPAGVVFMDEGFHFSFNWQNAWQTRSIDTTNPVFALSKDYPGQPQHYEGKARAPFIPSVMAAYNTGKWSLQFGFSVTGGGGKCEFSNGLGSFESAVGAIASKLSSFGATGYDVNSYMQGKQFYFGFTVGGAYKFNEHLSAYVGLRALYGTASYKAKVSDIMVNTASNGYVPFSTFLDQSNAYVTNTLATIDANLPTVNAGIEQLEPYKEVAGYSEKYQQLVATKASLEASKAQLEAAQPQLEQLGVYREGVNLQSDQTGWGIAPILGVDYKIGSFNFAAKYEFRTKMSMKNESTLKEAMAIAAVNKFQDGTSVREDSPALLAVGAQWSIIPNVRVSAGYHHFYDKQSKKYNDEQDKLSGGTNEYLGGIEVDPIKKLTVSGGVQFTRYGLTDSYMSDMSFVVNSWSFGLGAKYQFTDKVAVEAAYFQTNYDHYKQTTADANGSINDFTRTNKVLGLGVELTF